MKSNKIVSSVIAGFGAISNYLWGGFDLVLKTLVLFMFFDYLTGVMCGAKDKKLSSQIGFNGILKKVMILIVVAIAVNLDLIMDANGLIRSLVIFFYLGMEGLSILENAASMDVGVPESLKEKLLQLQNKDVK